VDTGEVTTWASGGDLRRPRVIAFDGDRDRFLVSSWGSGQVLAYDTSGAFLGHALAAASPTGLLVEADGSILVTNDQFAQVVRYGADGTAGETVVTLGDGGLVGATFLTEVVAADSEPAMLTDQAWLIGAGAFDGTMLEVEVIETRGARFGDAFDPDAVERIVWGTVRFSLVACDEATLAWEPAGAPTSAGTYPVIRVAPNLAGQRCAAEGIDAAAAQGTWFGGAERDGEGIMIDVLDDGRGVLTWYTYVP